MLSCQAHKDTRTLKLWTCVWSVDRRQGDLWKDGLKSVLKLRWNRKCSWSLCITDVSKNSGKVYISTFGTTLEEQKVMFLRMYMHFVFPPQARALRDFWRGLDTCCVVCPTLATRGRHVMTITFFPNPEIIFTMCVLLTSFWIFSNRFFLCFQFTISESPEWRHWQEKAKRGKS